MTWRRNRLGPLEDAPIILFQNRLGKRICITVARERFSPRIIGTLDVLGDTRVLMSDVVSLEFREARHLVLSPTLSHSLRSSM